MADFGGRMRMSISGIPLEIRGDFKLRPAGIEWSKITNGSGNASRSGKPEAPEMDLKLEATPGLDMVAIYNGGPYDVTIVEEDTGVVHMFTKANFGGKYEEDRVTGEISNVLLFCSVGNYQRATA